MGSEQKKGETGGSTFDYIRLGIPPDVLKCMDELRWVYRLDRSSFIRLLIVRGLISEGLVLDHESGKPIEMPASGKCPELFDFVDGKLFLKKEN